MMLMCLGDTEADEQVAGAGWGRRVEEGGDC